MRATAGQRRFFIKIGALLASATTVAASLLFLETPFSSAQTSAPTSYTPHLITVSPNGQLENRLDNTPITYDFNTELYFEDIEPKLLDSAGSTAPFQDACWFENDVTTWTTSGVAIETARQDYAGQTCFPIKKLAVSTIDSKTAVVVTPADSVAYSGNSSVELTYELPENTTVATAIEQHVVFRFADPTLTTRFTYYLPSTNPLNVSVMGPAVYRMKDKPGLPIRYTQLVSKPDVSTPTYQTTATVTLNRTGNSVVSPHYGSSITATQIADISTASQTQQQWRIVAGDKPGIDLSGTTKTNFSISAEVTNPNIDFSNDSTQDNSFDPKKGGTRAYVRKIFAGTGYGNPVTGASNAISSNNPNGCTMNGSASVNGDGFGQGNNAVINNSRSNCNGDDWKNVALTVYRDSGTRIDNCFLSKDGPDGCGGTYDALSYRFNHVFYGAGGGCIPPNGSTTTVGWYWDQYYSLGNSKYCWTPTSAMPLKIGNAYSNNLANNSYKIWFDHVENGSQQERVYNKYLTELTINGESISIAAPPLCVPPNSGQPNAITVDECRQIAADFGGIYKENKTADARNATVFLSSGRYSNARKKLLNIDSSSDTASGIILADHTFSSGPNAGTRVRVKLVNARIAGEWQGLLDDMGSKVDYTGYCATTEATPSLYGNWEKIFCSWFYNSNLRGLLWSTRYQVEVINPQVENTQVKATYSKMSQNRITAFGAENTYSTHTNQTDNIQTWSKPLPDGQTNTDPNSWVTLCDGGETSQAAGNSTSSRTEGNYGCGYSYLRQQYTPAPFGNATVRFRARNGYYQADSSGTPVGLSVKAESSTRQSISSTRISPPELANDPSGSYAYFGLNIPTQGTINLYTPYSGTNEGFGDPGNATLALGSVTAISATLQPKKFNIPYLNADGTPFTDLAAEIDRSVAPGQNSFTVKRPVTLINPQRFANWKLVWCKASDCNDPIPATRVSRSISTVTDENGNPLKDKFGFPITSVAESEGQAFGDILPGEIIQMEDIFGLTSPTGDLTYYDTYNRLAFIADTVIDTTQTPVYGVVREIDQGTGDKPFTASLIELFSGLPSLRARMLSSLWENQTYRNPYTYNGVQYSFDEARSIRAAVLNEDEPFPVRFLYGIRNLVVRQKWVVDGGTPSDTAPDGVTAALSLATGSVTQANSTWGQVYSTLTDGTTSVTIPNPPGTVNIAITPTASGTCSVDSISLAKTDSSAVGTNPTAGANNTWTYTTETSPLAADFTATFAVTCVHPATLRLMRAVTNIPNDVFGSLTTEVVDTWTAQQPASTDLTPTESTGDTKVYSIADTSTAVSLKSSSTNTMMAPIENWTCVVTGSDPQQSVAVTDPTNDAGTRTSTASVQLEANQDVTCTTAFGTSEVQSAAANITAGNTGTTPTLSSDVRLNFTALGVNDQPLTTADDRGALIADGVTAVLTANTDTPTAGTNLVRVRPDTSIQIKPSGNLAGLLYGIEEKQANGEWSALTLNSDGAAIIENIEGANLRVFRLAVQPAPTFPLPLTGGRPADLVLLAGALLAAVGAATGVGMSRRKAHATQL